MIVKPIWNVGMGNSVKMANVKKDSILILSREVYMIQESRMLRKIIPDVGVIFRIMEILY